MKTNHQRKFKEKQTSYVGKGRNGIRKNPDGTYKGLYKAFGDIGEVSNKAIVAVASTGDHCKGKHGIAKDIRGAKKFVRSRIRFHENAAVKKISLLTQAD